MRLVTTDGKTVGWQKNKDYHDRWCFTCGGQAKVKCPQPECDHGKIERLQRQQVNVDPFNKKAIFENVPVFVTCPKCKGQGWIVCPDCKDGKDKKIQDLPYDRLR